MAANGTLLRVIPERGWREVWHDAPCRGIMKKLPESLVLPADGISLPAWECLTCGTRMYAGLDAARRVITRAYGGKEE